MQTERTTSTCAKLRLGNRFDSVPIRQFAYYLADFLVFREVQACGSSPRRGPFLCAPGIVGGDE